RGRPCRPRPATTTVPTADGNSPSRSPAAPPNTSGAESSHDTHPAHLPSRPRTADPHRAGRRRPPRRQPLARVRTARRRPARHHRQLPGLHGPRRRPPPPRPLRPRPARPRRQRPPAGPLRPGRARGGHPRPPGPPRPPAGRRHRALHGRLRRRPRRRTPSRALPARRARRRRPGLPRAARPALAPHWNAHLAAYVDHDLTGRAPNLRSSCVLDAVRADGTDILTDPEAHAALHRRQVRATFFHAERGLLDEPRALYTPDQI